MGGAFYPAIPMQRSGILAWVERILRLYPCSGQESVHGRNALSCHTHAAVRNKYMGEVLFPAIPM